MKHLSISAKLWLAVLCMVLALGAVVGFASLRNKNQQAESAQRRRPWTTGWPWPASGVA